MTNAFLISLGRRIAARRKECHLTQEQVAERMNVSLQTVSCIELGKKAIRPENLANLCRALDVTADYLLFGERSPGQTNELFRQIAALPPEDYAMIVEMAERLSQK